MNVNIQICCKIVAIVICVLGLLSSCIAAPLDSFFDPTEENELTAQQRIQFFKDIRQMLDEDRAREQELKRFMGGSSSNSDSDATGLYRVMPQMPQKRFRPFRTQTRAGSGVALCLWKVCPAAPWLVSKRR